MAAPALSALSCQNLWFSYEVAENISTTAKFVGDDVTKAAAKKGTQAHGTHDGGLSMDMPRQQHLSGTRAAYKLQLEDVSFSLPAGSRTLLLGANGAGKSTLLSVLGGKHMVEEGMARVLGRPAFHDTSLATELALLTGNWTHTVAFVGHNVPYQAMEVSRLIESHSVGVDATRVQRLVSLLEVDSRWNLTTVSDGQRRRVQILCKLLKPSSVLLLDEITTDLDLLARQDLLAFLREEAEERGVTIVYCTHIFDGLDDWPTHIAYVSKGKLEFCKPMAELATLLVAPPAQAARGWGRLFCAVQRLLLQLSPEFESRLRGPAPPPLPPAADPSAAVSIRGLRWGYSGGGRAALAGVELSVARGSRSLLVGANGAGKTTLLRLIGGKHMVADGQLHVLGREAFGDTKLNTLVSMLSGDWTRQVACVGSGVPFQADFSVGFMAKAFADSLVRDGLPQSVVSARLERLTSLLDLDFEWRLHKVSDGQRRRAQLLLKLLRPSELLLLDEVTTDLDVLSRQALLQFLREETEQRGATVIYSTHIFDGLDDWPTHIIRMERGVVVSNSAAAPPAAAPPVGGGASGSLFCTVRAWLDKERTARRAEAASLDVSACPSTVSAMETEPAQPPPKPTAASKFDRFGGASRQSMYAR